MKVFKKSSKQEQKQILSPEKIMERIEETPNETNENEVEKVMEYLKAHPEYAKEILQGILDREHISNDLFEIIATEISVTDKIPDRVIPEAVENSDINVPDKIIDNILDNGNVNANETIKLINNIDDTKIKQRNVERQLQKIYTNCTKLPKDLDVLDKMNSLKIVDKNETIDDLERKIIAKRMASNLNQYGYTKISLFEPYINAEKMIETNFANMVQIEYDKIKNKKQKLNESSVRVLILDEVARNVVDNYNEVGEFLIPQSEKMSKLSEEEQEKFISCIQTKLGKKLDDSQITNIKFQIKGKIRNLRLKDYIAELRVLPKKEMEEYMSSTKELLEDKESLQIYQYIISSGMIETLKKVPNDRRKNYISAINETINKRIEESLKLKSENKEEIEER